MSNYNNNYGTPSPGPGPGSNRGGSGNDNDMIDTISWIVDIGLIFAWFPVGLFLTIANANGRNFVGNLLRSILGKNSKSAGTNDYRAAARSAYGTDSGRTTSSRTGQAPTYRRPAQQTEKQYADDAQGWKPLSEEEQAEKKEAKSVRRVDANAKTKEIFGWIIGIFGLLSTLGAVGNSLWSLLTCVAIALGGGALIFAGRKAKKKEAAFRRCMTISGEKGIVKLKTLASTLGMSEEDMEKQLDEMIDRGYYGARAYIDHARGLLVIEPEQMRDVYKAEDEAKARAKAEAPASGSSAKGPAGEYEKILAQIRQADVDIDDEAMSEKIRRMESITAAIFQEVEAHPEKKSQIDRFMNYYLPTTLKLLDAYARIEEQGVSGENMARSKEEIENIADTLVQGYARQLDRLYRAEAVDIAGDVSVIENMMRRDGLTGSKDFSFRKATDEYMRDMKRKEAEKAYAEAEAAAAPAETPAETPAVQTAGEGQVMGGH